MVGGSADDEGTNKPRPGIQSIEVGGKLLTVLLDSEQPQSLTNLAEAAGMTRTKALRYLTSFGRLGLVARINEKGRYELGPMALEMGYASMRRAKIMILGEEAINQLRDQLHTNSSIAVWGNKGVTLVRWAETPSIESPNIRLGVVFPVLSSAAGLTFAAFSDSMATRAAVERELAERSPDLLESGLVDRISLERALSQFRNQGFASKSGAIDPATTRIGAPVFDASDKMVAAILVAGPARRLDITEEGAPVKALLAAVNGISRKLGSRRSVGR